MKENPALKVALKHRSGIEEAYDYIERFDILETITNVGNDEVFTPKKICATMLDTLPSEVWSDKNLRWLNPCSKNGIFEREIALRLDRGLAAVIPDVEERRKHILQRMIFSLGLTRFTAHVTRRTLYYCSDAQRACDGRQARDGHFVNGYAIGNGTWFNDSEGNVLTPRAKHDFGKDGRCRYCGIRRNSVYVDPTQREQYAYEFIHHSKEELKTWLSDHFFKGDRTMKFDIIIGNPPYQLDDGGHANSNTPIYDKFVEAALALDPKYLCMIIPSRWMTGGKGLDAFRHLMLNDTHIKTLVDYTNGGDVFPASVEIKGGVCYFVRDRDHCDVCEITRHENGRTTTSHRYLKAEGSDVYIRYEEMLPISKKVRALNERPFIDLVSSQKPYGLRNDIFKDDRIDSLSAVRINDGYAVYGLAHNKRLIRYLPRTHHLMSRPAIDKYKLFVSRNQGDGHFGEKFSRPEFAGPNDICTDTYVVIGPFDTPQERDN